MKVTIHQPEHFPYLGFFQKMESADLFIILDDVNYRKNYFQNRNKFLNTKNEEEWFTITVEKHATRKHIKDVLVKQDGEWLEKILKKIKFNLGKDLQFIYEKKLKLIDINMDSIEYCRKALNIHTPIIKSSTMNLSPLSQKSQKLADICNICGATEYISGISGKDYLDEKLFNCKIQYFEPKVENYFSTLQYIK